MCNTNIELQFDIINPVTKSNKPRYEKDTNTFLFPVKKGYRYYIETRKIDQESGDITYFIILSKMKFNNNCRLCEVNGYGKCKFHPRGELKDYIIRETEERGNIMCNLIDTNSLYDTFSIV